MGYTFTIGNAEPKFHKDDFPYLHAEWDVDGATSDDAPTFPNDEMTANSSQRSPSYTVWADFCRALGITDVFYDTQGHLHAGHPGCQGITKEMLGVVSARLAAYRARSSLPPGFEDWHYEGPPRYDYHLARGIWLEWWMKWALENCETPAIANY
jgi:hypothetical protein